MKLFAIAIAFVASAAIANPPATTTTKTETATTTAPTTATTPAGHAGHGTKATTTKKTETATTATAPCTKEDAKAGKCKPEMTK